MGTASTTFLEKLVVSILMHEFQISDLTMQLLVHKKMGILDFYATSDCIRLHLSFSRTDTVSLLCSHAWFD